MNESQKYIYMYNDKKRKRREKMKENIWNYKRKISEKTKKERKICRKNVENTGKYEEKKMQSQAKKMSSD